MSIKGFESGGGARLLLGLWLVFCSTAAVAMPATSPALAYDLMGGGLANPNVVYMLLLLGLFGLIFEAATPGIIIPGALGGIALIVALAEFRGMPVRMEGLLLMLLGLLMILSPLMRVSYRALSWAGVAVFTLGAVWLLSDDSLGADLPMMSGLTLASAVFFLWLVARYERARETPPVTGTEGLVGRVALVLEDFEGKGRVSLDGTSWKAVSDEPLKKGDEVEVVAVKDLVLTVRKARAAAE